MLNHQSVMFSTSRSKWPGLGGRQVLEQGMDPGFSMVGCRSSKLCCRGGCTCYQPLFPTPYKFKQTILWEPPRTLSPLAAKNSTPLLASPPLSTLPRGGSSFRATPVHWGQLRKWKWQQGLAGGKLPWPTGSSQEQTGRENPPPIATDAATVSAKPSLHSPNEARRRLKLPPPTGQQGKQQQQEKGLWEWREVFSPALGKFLKVPRGSHHTIQSERMGAVRTLHLL